MTLAAVAFRRRSLAAVAFAWTTGRVKRSLIIDCDPGVDDGVALLLAFGSPKLDLLAITTVAGNVDAALTARNARIIRQIAGREDVPVHAGATAPLVRPPIAAAHFHGVSGLGDLAVFEPAAPLAEGHAVQAIIAAVEEPLDVLALERTNAFKGVYHVLHGAISPVNGIGPEDLRIRELVRRVDKGGVSEIIIATNPGLEGDATAMYIRRELTGRTVRLTRLARGLPVGSDIEYADSGTLSGALLGRSELS